MSECHLYYTYLFCRIKVLKFFIAHGTPIADNTTIDTVPTLHETWEITLQFYIAMYETGLKKSILRLTNTNANKGNEGDRIPAIFVNSKMKELQVYFGLEGEEDILFVHRNVPLSTQTWHNLTVQKVFEKGEFLLRVSLEDTQIYEKNIENWPSTYENVSVYAGDQFFSPPAIMGYVDHINILSGKILYILGAIQKLRNGLRGLGVNDFVTYLYIYFEREGVFYETST